MSTMRTLILLGLLSVVGCSSEDSTIPFDEDTGSADDTAVVEETAPADSASDSTEETAVDSSIDDSTADSSSADSAPSDSATTDATSDSLVDAPLDLAAKCVASGGTVGMTKCCASAGDFPATCAVGACSCAPSSSHNVKTCTCGTGKCWDGTTCK
jgi:hypothetical protein